ncbi:MAG: tRNA preQ1(34) S-adenosylmethionine ribosyltransferase-isomerase QueA [Rickettsiales bacterium]
MRVDLFDFELPEGRIAHAPANPRDSSKLLHVSQTLSDRIVRELPELLNPGDVLVFNDSRVIPARLFADIGDDRKVEVLLHQPLDGTMAWQAFARPAKKLKKGMVLNFGEDFAATVMGRSEDGMQVLIQFPYSAESLMEKLHQHGHVPLPPYITRADTEEDQHNYQTIYAKHDGSVAAPTAGLHFTPELMAALKGRGIHSAFVTLHVGAGTFQPVKVEDTDEHVMHREQIEISAEACNTINTARAAGGKVVAVGTTSLRILESIANADGSLTPYIGDTGIFITPGYQFKLVDWLMTNFHLPKSTLFMLVSAFAGLDRMQAAYAYAIEHNYRFYSYGDTSLLERGQP